MLDRESGDRASHIRWRLDTNTSWTKGWSSVILVFICSILKARPRSTSFTVTGGAFINLMKMDIGGVASSFVKAKTGALWAHFREGTLFSALCTNWKILAHSSGSICTSEVAEQITVRTSLPKRSKAPLLHSMYGRVKDVAPLSLPRQCELSHYWSASDRPTSSRSGRQILQLLVIALDWFLQKNPGIPVATCSRNDHLLAREFISYQSNLVQFLCSLIEVSPGPLFRGQPGPIEAGPSPFSCRQKWIQERTKVQVLVVNVDQKDFSQCMFCQIWLAMGTGPHVADDTQTLLKIAGTIRNSNSSSWILPKYIFKS